MIDSHTKQKLAAYFAAQPVDAVYLFGSQATGNTNPMSDVDLAILYAPEADRERRFDIKLAVLARTSGGNMPDRSDVIDLDESPLALAYQAIRPKYILYEKNRAHMIAKETDIIRRYLDFRPSLAAIAKRHVELVGERGLVS